MDNTPTIVNPEVIRFLARNIVIACGFDMMDAELKVRREQDKWISTSDEFQLLKNISMEIMLTKK